MGPFGISTRNGIDPIPATVRQWAGPGLEIELAFGIASALAALATAGMVYALAKRFGGGEGTAILATLLVTLIGALDIIPLIPHMVKVGHPVVVQDAWAMHEFRIHNFINQMIWAPQNVTGVLIVLLAVFLVSRRPSWRGWLLWGPIFASSVIGSSVWVAIGAFAGLAAWAGTARRFLVGTILVGALTLAMSWPMLWGYADSAGRQGGGLTGVFPRNDYAVFGWLAPPGPVANLLDFPMWLVLEFGARVLFLPLLAGAVWRRLWQDQGMRWLGFSSVMSLIAFNLVHSNLSYNAFGQRIILLPMVLTSILAGCVLAPGAGTVRWWNVGGCVWSGRIRSAAVKGLAAVVLLAGLPVGFWEAPLGTFRRYGEELARRRALPPDEQRDFDAEREAWAFMRRALPADAVVQPDPGPERATLAQIARRQLGVIGPQDDVLVFDPPDRTSYLRCVDRVSSVLRQGESAGETHRVLHRFHVTHVFIGIVERRSWSHMDRFDDQSYFEDAFRRGPVRVLRLR